MAYDISIYGAYSGRTNFNLQLYVRRNQVSGNSSSYAWELRANNPNGASSYYLDQIPWAVNVGGQGFSGTHNLDFRNRPSHITLATGTTGWFGHDANGYLNIVVDAYHGPGGAFGTADPPAATFQTDRIPKVPGAPFNVGVDQATTTSLRYMFSGTTDGGSQILEWQAQADEDSNFGSPITVATTGTYTFTGLTPGTTYYFRGRGRNAVGWGPWSIMDAKGQGTTLPATAPGMTVEPALSGTSATVLLSPPSGSTAGSITSYRVERRPIGGVAVVYNTPTSPLTAAPLTPGSTSEWRASAFVGTYQTPWTEWVTVTQPNPNTSPGDYFDGSSAAKPDTTYFWNGTANNSTSGASGNDPLGWASFAEGNGDSGGLGIVMRATGGRTGGFAARVVFFSDTTAAGFHAGLSGLGLGVASTSPGSTHSALIHVQMPGRSQRLAAMLLWVNGAGIEVGRTVGEDILVAADAAQWTGLRVTGEAPLGAVGVAVRVIDVEGSGWTPWLGGDILVIDDAITPFSDYYFDGSTPDNDEFMYEWEGTVNQSPSVRTNNPTPAPNPLLDPDCPPIPAPPRPPFIDDSCVEEEVVEWRRSSVNLEKADYWNTPQWIDLIPTLEIAASEDIRLVRIRYHENPFDRPLEELDQDAYCYEQIITFIPAGAILTIDGVSRRLWAEVTGSAQSLAADHLLATAQSGVPQWAELSCGNSYYLTVDLPADTPLDAVTVNYGLTARYS